MSKARLVFALSILIPAGVLAQNGVVQINQSTVMATGLNRATNGFPYTITQPGSYQLTGNLTVPVGTSGILISASNVTLDLNGFSIMTSCTDSCSGSGIGTVFLGTELTGISVRNGSVQGFNNGVELSGGGGFLVQNVKAQSNTHFGIDLEGQIAGAGIVDRCIAINNGDAGISGGAQLTVTESVASGNGGFGIQPGESSIVKGSSASRNHGAGIMAGGSSTLTGNTSNFNQGDGINVDVWCTLTDNTANSNGGNGIIGVGGDGSTFTGNTASQNSKWGFNVFCPSNLIGNMATANTLGPETETSTGCNKVNDLF